MKSEEEVKNKVCMHWYSGFFKKSQFNYAHIDEACLIPLRGIHEGIANVETNRDTGADRDIQRQTGTDRDRQGQTRTSRDKHGQTGTSRDKHVRKRMSLFVPVCPCLFPVCP